MPAGHRDAMRHEMLLGQLLVDGDHGGCEAAVRVNEAHDVHEPLHRTILTGHTVQGIEHHIGVGGDESGRKIAAFRRSGAKVNRHDLMPTLLERLNDAAGT